VTRDTAARSPRKNRRETSFVCSWGGCVVVMAPSTGADELVKFVKERFYANRPAADGKDVDQLIFTTDPSEGACCTHVAPSAGGPDLPTLAHF